jgi:hypothetical protein
MNGTGGQGPVYLDMRHPEGRMHRCAGVPLMV